MKLPPPARLGTTEDFFSIAAECSGVSASYSFGVFREFWANWGGSREQDPGSVSRGLESGRGSAHFEGSGVLLGFDDFNGMEYGVFKVPGHFQMKGSCFQTRLHFSCCFFFRSWKFISFRYLDNVVLTVLSCVEAMRILTQTFGRTHCNRPVF